MNDTHEARDESGNGHAGTSTVNDTSHHMTGGSSGTDSKTQSESSVSSETLPYPSARDTTPEPPARGIPPEPRPPTEQQQYQAMAYWARRRGQEPPRYVPQCDWDINKTGRAICEDWMSEQQQTRRTHKTRQKEARQSEEPQVSP